MRRPFLFFIYTLVLALSAPKWLQSQPKDDNKINNQRASRANSLRNFLHTGMNEWSFWSGFSFDSPAGSYIGLTEGREFFLAALQFGRTVAANRHVALEYTLDFIPVAVVTKNPKPNFDSAPDANNRGGEVQVSSVYGFGFSPVGLKFYFVQSQRSRLFLSASAGFLSFKEDVPLPEARKFNFAFDFGGGIQLLASARWGLTLGYRLHHLSNANTADANPGLDANIFYLGISSFR